MWKKLWKMFLAGWRNKPESLEPEICQCNHSRCYHKNGKNECIVATRPGFRCACQIFIKREDGGGKNHPKPSDTPAEKKSINDPVVKELERMYKL